MDMQPGWSFESQEVPYFLLSAEWKEKDVESGRIAYCMTSGETEELHTELCEKEIKRLLFDHDETYTSWVQTARITKEFSGALRFATVVIFRGRDAW